MTAFTSKTLDRAGSRAYVSVRFVQEAISFLSARFIGALVSSITPPRPTADALRGPGDSRRAL